METTIITVEVEVMAGISFFLVGLPDSAVKESQQRIEAALNRFGFRIPGKKIIINMAPANIRKEGSSFDLAIAVGILAASGQLDSEDIQQERLNSFIIMGELALDGTLRDFQGALPIAVEAAKAGYSGCIFPKSTAAECAELEDIPIFGAENLGDVISILSRPDKASRHLVSGGKREEDREVGIAGNERFYGNYDFAHIRGQTKAKYAMEIAAAGGHNIALIGPPGCGKSLLAKSMPSILPPLTKKESVETSKIYSIAGLLKNRSGFMRERPFRAPHHTSTIISMAGGGKWVEPGEISLAHNGVLFLDEFGEFSRPVIELLRQPLEDGYIQISRVKSKYILPADFILLATMNPCPCGYLGDPVKSCSCSSSAISRYRSRISGPIRDRIDLHLYMEPVTGAEIAGPERGEPSCEVAARVARAREIQNLRYRGEPFSVNGSIPAGKLDIYCKLQLRERRFMGEIISRSGLSARAYGRILKISRTIADLDGKDFISLEHISGALQFREERLELI